MMLWELNTMIGAGGGAKKLTCSIAGNPCYKPFNVAILAY
jgi:hypothetical protein